MRQFSLSRNDDHHITRSSRLTGQPFIGSEHALPLIGGFYSGWLAQVLRSL
jgi:hypothetical protein